MSTNRGRTQNFGKLLTFAGGYTIQLSFYLIKNPGKTGSPVRVWTGKGEKPPQNSNKRLKQFAYGGQSPPAALQIKGTFYLESEYEDSGVARDGGTAAQPPGTGRETYFSEG
ncbi:MAG: hypothetical protein LBS65_07300 [Desulfovibrio sp.]|jgi:hypothetical protein|nr:hypothetical protein [Desulfovibrio sp.]